MTFRCPECKKEFPDTVITWGFRGPCPECKKWVDEWIQIDKATGAPVLSVNTAPLSCPRCGAGPDVYKPFRLGDKDAHSCTSCGYKDYATDDTRNDQTGPRPQEPRTTLKAILSKYRDAIRGRKIFLAPTIPDSKLSTAISAYANGVRPGDVLVLIDGTVLGLADRGVLLTPSCLYAKEFQGPKKYPLAEIRTVSVEGGKQSGELSKLVVNGESVQDCQTQREALEQFAAMILEVARLPPDEVQENAIPQSSSALTGEQRINNGADTQKDSTNTPSESEAQADLADAERAFPVATSAYAPDGRSLTPVWLISALGIPVAALVAFLSAAVLTVILAFASKILVWVIGWVLVVVESVLQLGTLVAGGHPSTGGSDEGLLRFLLGLAYVISSGVTGAAAGMAAGGIAAKAARNGRCRSIGSVSRIGVVAVAVAIVPILAIACMSGTSDDMSVIPGGRWLFVACVLVMGVAGCVSAAQDAAARVRKQFFCSECELYMEERGLPSLSRAATAAVTKAARTADVDAIIKGLQGERGAFATPILYRCNRCGKAFAEIMVKYRVEAIAKTSKGMRFKKTVSKEWLAASTALDKEAASKITESGQP